SDEDWQRQSAAAGWRVQDVVANMGSAYRALVGPAALELMRSNDIERTNDALVDQRRDWLPTRVIAEYERWSQVMLRLIGPVSRTPLARAPMRLAELGRFRVSQLLCAIVFDTHTDLRHDIAPALGRAVPDSDAEPDGGRPRMDDGSTEQSAARDPARVAGPGRCRSRCPG